MLYADDAGVVSRSQEGLLRIVGMAQKQVMSDIVLDGGGHFIPAGIFGLHTLSLVLSSQAAHDRDTEGTCTHTGKEHQSTNIRHTRTIVNVSTVHKPRRGGINSVSL